MSDEIEVKKEKIGGTVRFKLVMSAKQFLVWKFNEFGIKFWKWYTSSEGQLAMLTSRVIIPDSSMLAFAILHILGKS